MSGTLTPPTAPGGALPALGPETCGHGYRNRDACPACVQAAKDLTRKGPR